MEPNWLTKYCRPINDYHPRNFSFTTKGNPIIFRKKIFEKECIFFHTQAASSSRFDLCKFPLKLAVSNIFTSYNSLRFVNRSLCQQKSFDLDISSVVIDEKFSSVIKEAEQYFQNIPQQDLTCKTPEFHQSLFKLSIMYLNSLKEESLLENLNKYYSKIIALGGGSDIKTMALWSCYAGYITIDKPNSPSQTYLSTALDLIKSNLRHDNEVHRYITIPIYKGLANLHYHLGNSGEDFKYAQKAMELGSSLEYEPTDHIHHLVDVYSILAAIQMKRAKYKDAEDFYKKGLEYCKFSSSKLSRHAKSQILFGLSQLGVLTSSFDDVKNYLVEYINMMSTEDAPPTLNVARAYINLGIAYLQQGNIEDSLVNLERGREMAKTFNAQVFVQHAENLIRKISERNDPLSKIESKDPIRT